VHYSYYNIARPLTTLKREIETREIQLHPQDGPSIILWAARLSAGQALVTFKMSCDPAPVGSGLASDAFIVIIQMSYQKQKFRDWGKSFIEIDATHNTTQYENVSLFTIIVCDQWGHGKQIEQSLSGFSTESESGMPVAWMISSNATEVTIVYILLRIREESPDIEPKWVMSDKDRAQMNAVRHVYQEHISSFVGGMCCMLGNSTL
jgi:hypothetical protein